MRGTAGRARLGGAVKPVSFFQAIPLGSKLAVTYAVLVVIDVD